MSAAGKAGAVRRRGRPAQVRRASRNLAIEYCWAEGRQLLQADTAESPGRRLLGRLPFAA